MAPAEKDVYAYCDFLLRTREGATAVSSFLKSIGFMHGCFRFMNVDIAELVSPRVKGTARNMLQQKRVIVQAPPLPAKVMYKLEKALNQTLTGF